MEKKLGNIYGFRGGGFYGTLYSKGADYPTLLGGIYKGNSPNVIHATKVVGGLEKKEVMVEHNSISRTEYIRWEI